MSAVQEEMFTQDWVTSHVGAWTHLLSMLERRDKFLEIGSFEGRSACWFLENGLSENGTLFCVDTWKGSPEFVHLGHVSMTDALNRFKENTGRSKKRGQSIEVRREESQLALMRLILDGHENSFDMIYVDGSHRASDVIADTCLAWRLLKPDGVMIFDDYIFHMSSDIEDRPKAAIDAFHTLFNSQLVVVMVGDQFVISKRPLK